MINVSKYYLPCLKLLARLIIPRLLYCPCHGFKAKTCWHNDIDRYIKPWGNLYVIGFRVDTPGKKITIVFGEQIKENKQQYSVEGKN